MSPCGYAVRDPPEASLVHEQLREWKGGEWRPPDAMADGSWRLSIPASWTSPRGPGEDTRVLPLWDNSELCSVQTEFLSGKGLQAGNWLHSPPFVGSVPFLSHSLWAFPKITSQINHLLGSASGGSQPTKTCVRNGLRKETLRMEFWTWIIPQADSKRAALWGVRWALLCRGSQLQRLLCVNA